jgi:hypothetical protein
MSNLDEKMNESKGVTNAIDIESDTESDTEFWFDDLPEVRLNMITTEKMDSGDCFYNEYTFELLEGKIPSDASLAKVFISGYVEKQLRWFDERCHETFGYGFEQGRILSGRIINRLLRDKFSFDDVYKIESWWGTKKATAFE